MSKEIVTGFALAAVFIAGAVYSIKVLMADKADWKAYEAVKAGDSLEQVDYRFNPKIGDFHTATEARADGFEPEFHAAVATGAARLCVYKSGKATLFFGFKNGMLTYKDARDE